MTDLRQDFTFDGMVLKSFPHLSDEERSMVLAWRNSDAVRPHMFTDHRISPEEHAAFIGRLRAGDDFYWLVIGADGCGAGVIYLNRVDRRNAHAYLGLYANPERRVSGTGRVLIGLLKRLSFETAGLHTLKLEVIADNGRAIELYRKSGFETEGRLVEFVRKDGCWKDVVVMGIRNER